VNFYPHYLGDYARDTSHLTLTEHGAYRMMLDTCYATEKPLPADKQALYRICKAFSAAERKAVDKVAEEFFPVNGDGSRHNTRADSEIAKANAYAHAQSMRAHKRWHKQSDMPDESRNDANHNHNHKKKNTTAVEAAQGFEEFWQAYPPRAGGNPKNRAAKAYSARLHEGHTPSEILAGAKRYADFIRDTGKAGTEFVLQAATFLGPDKRFRDEWDKPSKGNGQDTGEEI
jgi:uncharacterized protein YdaU (DUF1376 family)